MGIVTKSDKWLSGCKQKVMINDTASGRCVCVKVTANEIPSRRGWNCQHDSPFLFNIFANDLEKAGEMHGIYFIWFSRKDARLSPAPGRPPISKHRSPTVCREMDCSKAVRVMVWEWVRWRRWWQQHKRICSNYLPGEGAAQKQASSWRKQNSVKQINKSMRGGKRGASNKPAEIFAPNYIKCFFGGISYLLLSGVTAFIHITVQWIERKRWDDIHYLIIIKVLNDKGGTAAAGRFEWVEQRRSRGGEIVGAAQAEILPNMLKSMGNWLFLFCHLDGGRHGSAMSYASCCQQRSNIV